MIPLTRGRWPGSCGKPTSSECYLSCSSTSCWRGCCCARSCCGNYWRRCCALWLCAPVCPDSLWGGSWWIAKPCLLPCGGSFLNPRWLTQEPEGPHVQSLISSQEDDACPGTHFRTAPPPPVPPLGPWGAGPCWNHVCLLIIHSPPSDFSGLREGAVGLLSEARNASGSQSLPQ